MNLKRPIHESEVNVETWYPGTEQEILGRALCDVGGRSRIGVGLLELPTGSNTKPAHYHTREEEHLYALEGSATLHLGDSTFPLTPGSYVCFPAGQADLHYIENSGNDTFRYLMVGERIADDEVVRGFDQDNEKPSPFGRRDHTWFELRRQIDGLVYVFDRIHRDDGSIGYKRRDADHWIVFDEGLGWVALNESTGEIGGRPWNVLPQAQGDYPPEGEWVSKKGERSYVYSLVYPPSEPEPWKMSASGR